MLRSLAWCAAAVATASLAHAQTATETVNLGTRTVEGSGDTLNIGTGFFQTAEPFVAWRFISDFSQLNNADFPVSPSIRVGFRTPAGLPISSLIVRPLNGNPAVGSDVQGLTFASTFESDPTASTTVGFEIRSIGATGDGAIFANATLEFFTPSDLPARPIATDLLDATAPDIDVDLGFIALDGDAVEITVDDQNGAWGDPTLVIYTSDGSPVTFVEEGIVFSELDSFLPPDPAAVVVSPDVVSVEADGSLGFRRFGPGEYAVAVMNDLDDDDGPFGAQGDNTITVDGIVTINGTTATVPMAQINNDANQVGWIKFSVGARAANFNADGSADTNDVTDFLVTAETGAADFNSDGSTDIFDILEFLRTFDAGG